MSPEVQRSRIGVPAAKRRTTQAILAGATPTWFTDTRANPKWLGRVPGVRFNPDIPWDMVPRPRTVSVARVRHIVERNCRNISPGTHMLALASDSVGQPLIIRLIIQTILLDPSGSVWSPSRPTRHST